MLYQIDNQEIGTYIAGLIERGFMSARQFCIAYLQADGIKEPTSGDIQKMANRLSQIMKGTKAIQIYDLPIFSELLHVSIESILSAGKYGEPKNNRMTNYTIAQSRNKKEWTAYIEEEDKPILNSDEYGKTALDYAIMFGNYSFLKFLINKKYIWFDSQNKNDYVISFGAGTSIQRIISEEQYNNGVSIVDYSDRDILDYKLKTEDQLRRSIILFAADHNDLSMMYKLRAREIPALYFRARGVFQLALALPKDDYKEYYDKNMISHIAKSSDKVLNYFTDPFEIQVQYSNGSSYKVMFVFPYISRLLDMLIENNSPFLKTALEKSLAHNENARNRLEFSIKEFTNNDPFYRGDWKSYFDFYENENMIAFRGNIVAAKFITNIARTTKESKSADSQINVLIEKINDSYNGMKYFAKEE